MSITFISTKYPELRVHGVGRFKGGRFTASKPAEIERLRASRHMGVREADGELSPAPVDAVLKEAFKAADGPDPQHSAPSRSASRAVWAEYAESQGVDTAGLKRAEIIAKLEA